MSRIGECPYCYDDIDGYLFEHFNACDFPLDFEIECQTCKKIISVDIRTVPEFVCKQKDPKCPGCSKKVKSDGYCAGI